MTVDLEAAIGLINTFIVSARREFDVCVHGKILYTILLAQRFRLGVNLIESLIEYIIDNTHRVHNLVDNSWQLVAPLYYRSLSLSSEYRAMSAVNFQLRVNRMPTAR